MEQLQQNIDRMHQTLVQLNGAFNTHLEQIRILESRMGQMESSFSNLQQAQVEAPPNANDVLTPEYLESIRRLPDCVRDIQVLEGNPTQYVSWVHNVESILKDYDIVKHKPIFGTILKHIRQKIIGPADNALVTYNIFDDSWANIKKCLSLHYADKRDMQSLENKLITMRQGKDSIDQFYNKVNYQLSLIINKIKTDECSDAGMAVLVENYRHRVLDVFIRGLPQNLSQLIKVQNPSNLPQAYTACLELQNMDYRKSISNNNVHNYVPIQHGFNRNNIPNMEYLPTPRMNRQYQDHAPRDFPLKPLLPVRIQHRPFEIQNSAPVRYPTNNNYVPPRPTQPKPPVPMEVDPSIQTGRINYMNRANAVVRQSNESSNIPRKHQKMFNIETIEESPQDQPATEEEEQEAEQEYLDVFEEECQEINFMTGASLECPS